MAYTDSTKRWFRNSALAATAILSSIGALAQSAHDSVANDGSTVRQFEAAAYVQGANPRGAPAFAGAARVTKEALQREGVEIQGATLRSDADFRRAVELPDRASSKNADAKVIIGVDRRERVYTTIFPSRARVLIQFGGGRCSGTLISSNTVITAGHCVHTGGPGGSWQPVDSYRIYAGADGASTPYGVCTARTLYSVVGWVTNGDEQYDYGAIKLNCTVGNTVGWYGYNSSAAALNNPAVVGGYPGDKPLTQWIHADKVREITSEQIFYANDTTPGSSGSGVWWDNGGAILIGIHAYGTHGSSYPHTTYNHGKRVTSAVVTNFNFWRGL